MSDGNRSRILVLLTLSLVWMTVSCGEDEPPIVRVNQPPTVKIIQPPDGPILTGTFSYALAIEWIGNDPDGFVARYEYVVDPPAAFTEEEIAMGGPGITSEVLKDLDGELVVTRVSKEVNGETISFDWIHTVETTRNFRFSTSEPETTYQEGGPEPSGRFTGMHAVYVRAVDDEEAVSEPDQVAFTAETVAPTTTIIRPSIEQESLILGLEARVEWTGEDPDGAGGADPVAYRYALLRLDTLTPPFSLVLAYPGLLFKYVDEEDWIQLEDVGELTLQMERGGAYLFGIRAEDEAGAVEPFLEFGRNAFKFQALSGGGVPEVTVFSQILGSFRSQGEVSSFEVNIFAGTDLGLRLACDAGDYGESCLEYRWGTSLFGPESPPWTTDPELPPIIFNTPGNHVLYIQARDTLGHITTITLLVNAIQFRRDREVLWVDDAKDTVFPTDAEHDAFWRNLFQNHPEPLDWYEFQASSSENPEVPTLEELGRYRLLVWENSFGSAGQSALLRASTLEPVLRAYVAAGGKLWIGGRVSVTAMLPSANGVGADLNYPKEDIGPGDFAYDFMKLRSTRINREVGSTIKHFLTGVSPFPGAPVVYDSMTVDVSKLRQPFQFALTHVDAVFDPIFGENDPAFVGDIDTLYAYRAYGSEVTNQPSSYHNKLVGLRWHDPSPKPIHGRIQWFGFPMYYMFENEAQDTFNKSLDWFREGP